MNRALWAAAATGVQVGAAIVASRFAVADSQVGAMKSTLTFLQNQIKAWNGGGD